MASAGVLYVNYKMLGFEVLLAAVKGADVLVKFYVCFYKVYMSAILFLITYVGVPCTQG